MNHKELTQKISSKFRFKLSFSEKLLNQIYTEITQELLRKKRVYLRALGTFNSLHRPARRYYDPKTKKIKTRPAYDDVIFRPAKQLLKKFVKLNQKHEERFKILDQIKANLPNIPEEEIKKDINRTIKIIRKKQQKPKKH